MIDAMKGTACAAASLLLLSAPALAQIDPGIRGGQATTAGMLQYRGIPIPPPPVISPHPTTGATITTNELASFKEGILRAGQLEATCNECAMITEGTPVTNRGELDPTFPQFTTNSNGLGARHNADQCFGCHAQPTLGGSGGFLVPNPAPQGTFTPLQPENPMFRLFPFRFASETWCQASSCNSDRYAKSASSIRWTRRATSFATRIATSFPMAA